MPFLSASKLTEPVTEVSRVISPPSFFLNLSGSLKLEIPTCWMDWCAPLIIAAGPFCRSGILEA